MFPGSWLRLYINWSSSLNLKYIENGLNIMKKPFGGGWKNGSYKFFENPLREKFPYSEFFWSVYSRIWTEYGEIRSISVYSVR